MPIREIAGAKEVGTGSVSPVPSPKTASAPGYEAASVSAWGIDTIALAIRLGADPDAYSAMAAATEHRELCHPEVPGGRLPITVYPSGNWNADCEYAHLLGYTQYGLLKTEGRLASLFARERSVRTLASPSSLAAAGGAARWLAERAIGVPLANPSVVVQRLDLTVDLAFQDAAEGQGLIALLRSVHLPRYAPKAEPCPGRRGVWEGISWKTASNHTHIRIYDKGLQLEQQKLPGASAPGKLIRIERQMTFPKGRQISPVELAGTDLRAAFLGGFAPLVDGFKGLRVCGVLAAASHLTRLRDEAKISRRVAARLCGEVTNAQMSGEAAFTDDRDLKRFERELRALALVFSREAAAHTDIDVGAPLALAASCWPTVPAPAGNEKALARTRP